MVFSYSYFFYPNQHPIPCIIKAKTGEECNTCGFSKSFGHYTHFEFNEGKMINPKSYLVFIYFLFQFFMRLSILLIHHLNLSYLGEKFIKTDLVISISGFLFAFLPIIIS